MEVPTIKRLTCSIAVCLFIFSASHFTALAEKNKQELVFQANSLSADFDNKTLKEVLGCFTKEKGVWVKGDETFLNEKISSHFQNLTLENGLKRILNRFNYGILYTKKGDVLGVYIFGKGNNNNLNLESNARQVDLSNQDLENQFKKKEQVEVIVNCPPPGGLDKAEAEAIKKKLFNIQENVPPPGEPISATPEQEIIEIQENVPPPGEPISVTPEQPKMPDIQKNVEPPHKTSPRQIPIAR
jgi:hypothetical protein